MPITALAVLCACAFPAVAAATPTLQSPAAGATTSEGKTVSYEWTGDLMGADAAQAYFKVEVIDASKAPAGQQSPWPDADTSKITDAGAATTSLEMGAPPAGSWKWRVCAWGVVDPNVSPTVEQIPNGCSVARALTSSAAIAGADGTVQEIEEQHHVTVASAPKIIQKVRPSTAAPAVTTPAPKHVAPAVAKTPADVIQPIKVESRPVEAKTSGGGAKSSLALSKDSGIGDADSDQASSRGSSGGDISGALASGLGATIPGVPIPFWVLLFLIASVPIAVVWRRSVLAMFEWSDGSIDGFGTPDSQAGRVLAAVHVAQSAHAYGGAADDASTTSITEPTDQSQRAA